MKSDEMRASGSAPQGEQRAEMPHRRGERSLRDRARRLAKWWVRAYTIPTAPLRPLPDFLIIGTQRGGTTSLYRYLVQHPSIAPAILDKGVHYFDTNHGKSTNWYRAHFRTKIARASQGRRSGHHVLTGEASPYYSFHPGVPARVAQLVPDARLILLLRDPVKRAYSHHQHEVARGFEDLPFDEAVRREPERLAGEAERMERDPSYYSYRHQHHSYLARGLYLEQIKRWHALFPREHLLVMKSEDLYARPDDAYRDVLRFLDLPERSLTAYEQLNARSYEPMSTAMREYLGDYYAEPNRALGEYLGLEVDWSR
jgi:Sulfotransferase domain